MDINAVKARLAKLNNKNSKSDMIWKPEEGNNVIRIIPYIHQKDYPFIEAYFHYGIAKRTFVSPITVGKADPMVEFADKLRDAGGDENKEMAKNFYPKLRTYVPVIVRGKESEGVKFWGFGKTVYQELLAIIADPDYGNITDPVNGRDLTIEFTPGKKATDNKTSIRVKPNTSAISDKKEVIEKVTEQPNFLTELYQIATYEELKQALENYLNPDEEKTETEGVFAKTSIEEEKEESTPKATTKISEPTKVEDVGAAFDKLFGGK